MQYARQLVAQNLRKNHELQEIFITENRDNRQNDCQIHQQLLIYIPSFTKGNFKAFTNPVSQSKNHHEELQNNVYEVRIYKKKNWITEAVAI